jgi:hypothetical protein
MQQRTAKGFTLIELLLYLSLALIMLAVLSGIGANVLESRLKARTHEEVQYTGQFVFERISSAIEGAKDILSPSVGESGFTLVLEMEDPEKDPTVIRFENESITLQEGEEEPVTLIGNAVAVPLLEFHNISRGASSPSVRTILQVEAFNPEDRSVFDAALTFYSTFAIRP